jgi:hypothetical protein
MSNLSKSGINLQKGLIACGPMTISRTAVCRRRLRDNFNVLLDRLSQETGPEQMLGPEVPEGHTMMPDGIIMADGHLKKQEAKKKAKDKEKNDPVKQLAEALRGGMSQGFGEGRLQGNSRLLQRLDGKIEKR